MKRIKIRLLEGLSPSVVRLRVKGWLPVKYLSSGNEISDFDIYTAVGGECDWCHLKVNSGQEYNLDSLIS